MPNLGNFLGALLGEIAAGRLQGDVETLRIADIYASHELLKHLPVPRFRLSEVRIDLPAIVENGGGEPAPEIDPKKTAAAVKEAVRRRLERGEIALTQNQERRLAQVVRQEIEEHANTPLPRPAAAAADRVVAELRGVLRKLPEEQQEPLLRDVRQEVLRTIVLARAASSHVSILPHTAAVREVVDPERLVRFHLLVSEEAVEWTVIQTATGASERLVQE